MQTRGIRLFAITMALFYGTGCATIIHGGGQQTVPISTEPSGAKVHVGGQEIITPSDVTLDRNRTYQVIASKQGYQDANTTIESRFSWVTCLDLVFIVPWAVDLISGGAYRLDPDNVNLVLQPAENAQHAER